MYGMDSLMCHLVNIVFWLNHFAHGATRGHRGQDRIQAILKGELATLFLQIPKEKRVHDLH